SRPTPSMRVTGAAAGAQTSSGARAHWWHRSCRTGCSVASTVRLRARAPEGATTVGCVRWCDGDGDEPAHEEEHESGHGPEAGPEAVQRRVRRAVRRREGARHAGGAGLWRPAPGERGTE